MGIRGVTRGGGAGTAGGRGAERTKRGGEGVGRGSGGLGMCGRGEWIVRGVLCGSDMIHSRQARSVLGKVRFRGKSGDG